MSWNSSIAQSLAFLLSLEQGLAESTDYEGLRTLQGNELTKFSIVCQCQSHYSLQPLVLFIFSFGISFPSLLQYKYVTEFGGKKKKKSPSHYSPIVLSLLHMQPPLSVNYESFQKMSSHLYTFYPLFYTNGVVLCSFLFNSVSTYILHHSP